VTRIILAGSLIDAIPSIVPNFGQFANLRSSDEQISTKKQQKLSIPHRKAYSGASLTVKIIVTQGTGGIGLREPSAYHARL